MAFKSQKGIGPHWYIPEDQQELDGGERPLRFKIRQLTSAEQADVLAGVASAGGGNVATFRDCFRIGCMDIDEAQKPNGKPCRNSASFLMLPDSFDYIVEVGAVIFDESFLTEEEKKTSSSE